MGSIDFKKLNQALARAKNVGVVELPFSIGECDLVLRSMRSEEYTAALKECDGFPEEEYIAQYQKSHLSRAIVEVNGVDLRDTQFVTVEEPDKAGGTKKVKLELHRYLADHMLNTWGKEAMDVAFRKLGEVLEVADRKAKEGVTFIAPEETPEEKYRRLLLETRAAEKDLPDSLLDRILDEQGLIRKSTAEEIKQAMSRADELAREQEREREASAALEPVSEPPEEAPPEATVEEEVPEPPAKPVVEDPHVALQRAILRRTPEVRSEQSEEVKPSTRAAQIAALEGSDQEEPDVSAAVSLHSGSEDIVEIRRTPVDPQAASAIVDNPPVAGINPKFRPPQRA